MHINETVAEAHATAIKKGFWDKEYNLGEKLMLITSELGEALEADRTGKSANRNQYEKDVQNSWNEFTNSIGKTREEDSIIHAKYLNTVVESFKENIKDSFEDELANAIIRIFDLAGKRAIDLEYHIRKKMDYNNTRAKLHGKKY